MRYKNLLCYMCHLSLLLSLQPITNFASNQVRKSKKFKFYVIICLIHFIPLDNVFIISKNMYPINSKHRTLKLSLNTQVPDLTEISSSLGPSLAQLFFEYSHDNTKQMLGSESSSKHPKQCCTINTPLNKTIFSIPIHSEVIKADIHQNILDLGTELLDKFQLRIEENLQKSIENQFEEKYHMYQAQKRNEIELKTRQLHAKYENYIKSMQHELEEKLEIEWANAFAKCKKDIQKAVVKERLIVIREMLQKIRTEVRYIIESLYKEFEESFCAKRENIISDFNEIMRKEHVKLNKTMKEFERNKAKDLYVQRHELEMQSAVDVMYILCLERLRCHTEKHAMHNHFEKQMKIFHNEITQLNSTVNTMKEEITETYIHRRLLEEQLAKIVKEFQKFVNFIFHAVPGQAEFLLPLSLLQIITHNDNKEEKQNNSCKVSSSGKHHNIFTQ